MISLIWYVFSPSILSLLLPGGFFLFCLSASGKKIIPQTIWLLLFFLIPYLLGLLWGIFLENRIPNGTLQFREKLPEYISTPPVFTGDGNIHLSTRNYHFSLRSHGKMIDEECQNLASKGDQGEDAIVEEEELIIIDGLRLEKNKLP